MHIQIEGMTCQHCQRAVQEALAEVPGVESVRVDLETGSAWVDGAAKPDQVREAVLEAGYSIREGR